MIWNSVDSRYDDGINFFESLYSKVQIITSDAIPSAMEHECPGGGGGGGRDSENDIVDVVVRDSGVSGLGVSMQDGVPVW